jgi:dTDP-4-dehydrorhamnose 3,5-epimerase
VESWNRRLLQEQGIDIEFVQDNHSLSVPAGTLRGMHFQAPPFAQAKLVRCTRGSILDVAVDIRVGSPTFGQAVAATLSAQNMQQLFVPEGFAHGFCTLEDNTEVQYKVNAYYSAEADGGIAWNDPAIGIDWPVTAANVLLSDKDKQHPTLAVLDNPFHY